MSLRTKILVYLALIHLILGAIAIFVLLENRLWLLVVEGLFVVSIGVGLLLVRALFVPLRLIRTGAELIQERDFATHFREVGQPEMDDLIRIYNNMIDRLREERLKLEEQHVLLAKILAASPSGILILDFDERIRLINASAADMLQVRAAEVLGRMLSEVGGEVTGAMAGLGTGESRVLTQQGSRRLRCSRAEFLDQGFPRSFFIVEELTDELRASEKAAYQKLIRMMSHEVNNSVGSVCSLLDSCRAYGAQLGAEDQEDFSRAVEVATARMRNLNVFMNGFADVVRLPAPERRPCDLKRLVDDILLLLRPELEGRRIAHQWAAAERLPPIPMDKNQIEQVLVNVLKNATEAIGSDGRITLRLTLRDGHPYLAIGDSGGGIPESVLPALFTPFFSTKKDGRGLGLTVVQEILGHHRFDFGIRNRPGEGAEFWIQF